MSEGDRRLRRLMRELRAEEAARAPSFERLFEAARRSRRSRRRPRLAPALAAAGLVAALAAAVVWQVTVPSPGEVEPAAGELAASLSGWRGPLDFLLEAPGGELLGGEPALPGSALALPQPSKPSLIELREAI